MAAAREPAQLSMMLECIDGVRREKPVAPEAGIAESWPAFKAEVQRRSNAATVGHACRPPQLSSCFG